MIDINDVIESLDRLMNQKTVHDKARNAYTGYEWDYHGYHETTALNRAKDNFKETLDSYIENRVKEVLSEKYNGEKVNE